MYVYRHIHIYIYLYLYICALFFAFDLRQRQDNEKRYRTSPQVREVIGDLAGKAWPSTRPWLHRTQPAEAAKRQTKVKAGQATKINPGQKMYTEEKHNLCKASCRPTLAYILVTLLYEYGRGKYVRTRRNDTEQPLKCAKSLPI